VHRLGEPIELRIYPGADADFTLYEDANDGYGYEHGEYTTTRIGWADLPGLLSIGPRTFDIGRSYSAPLRAATVRRPADGDADAMSAED
jgi:hypothetical protein